jgi:hypothetical protein
MPIAFTAPPRLELTITSSSPLTSRMYRQTFPSLLHSHTGPAMNFNRHHRRVLAVGDFSQSRDELIKERGSIGT